MSGTWHRLTTPVDSVTDPERRRHAQLLCALLLTLPPVGLVVSALPGLLIPQLTFPGRHVWLVVAALPVWAASYVLGRRGRYEVGTVIAMGAAIAVVFASTIIDAHDFELTYLLLPLLLGSVVLRTRTLLLFGAAIVGAVLFLPLVEPAFSLRALVIRPVSFLTLGMTLLVVTSRHRRVVERARTEERARSQARYRDLFESTFDGIALYVDGRIVECNAGLARMLGREPREIVGSDFTEWMEPESQRRFDAALETGTMTPIDISGRRADGAKLYAEIVVRFRSATGHRVRDGLLAVRDVTQRRQAEETFHAAQRLDSIGLLAGGVAHDYNNLLMVVKGNAALARHRIARGEDADHQLTTVLQSADRGRELTEQLLAYAGRSVMQREPHDINQLLNEQRVLFEAALPHNAWLELDLAPDLPDVECDAAQVGQVLTNMILNGADAQGETRAAVTVRTRAATFDSGPDFDALGGPPLGPGPYVLIDIQDRGQGMDEETTRRLFDPFFTTKTGGHGLGLAAAAGILRAHRAGARVQSALGKGTTFTLALPAAAASGGVTGPTPATPRAVADGESVMVVDDEPAVLETMTALLRSTGVQVVAANSGKEAVEIFRSRSGEFGAVVLDLKMPEMDGESTFHELKTLDPQVKVLFASGFSEPHQVRQLTQRGEASFIRKPFEADEISHALAALIRSR